VPIRRSLAAAAIAALTVTGVGATAGTASAAPPAGSALGSYIVTLAPGSAPTQVARLAGSRLGGRVGYVYAAALNGFSVTVPAAVGMFVLRNELVATLFQLGKFDAADTQLVASALLYFALGLVSYALVEVLTRGFYALHDTRTPVLVAVVTVAINVASR